ncbi:MAG: hypothetical protein ACOCZ5_00135 [bacterium]
MSKKNEAFKGLDKIFETSAALCDEQNEIVDIKKEISTIDDKKNNIKQNLVVMNDVSYIKEELIGLISSSKNILEKLEDDIKVGSPARMYEVYASLLNSITNELKELRQLNYEVAQLEVEQHKKKTLDDLQNPKDKILLSSSALLDMIHSAGKVSEMNKIEADFKIEDSYDEGVKKKEK